MSSGAIAAAIGPLIGGFVTTLLSWRVGFMVEALIIGIVLLGSRGIRDVPYTGDRSIDVPGAFLSVIGMGGLVVGVLCLAGGRRVRRAAPGDRRGRDGGPRVLARPAQASGQGHAARPHPVRLQAVQQRRRPDHAPAGRTWRAPRRLADLPAARLGLQRARGGHHARAPVAHDVRRRTARGTESGSSEGEQHHPGGLRAARCVDRHPHPRWCPERTPAGTWWSRSCSRAPGSAFSHPSSTTTRSSPHLGGTGRRGGRRHVGHRVVRSVVRSGLRRSSHARHAVDRLHEHGGVEQRPAAGRPAARRRRCSRTTRR